MHAGSRLEERALRDRARVRRGTRRCSRWLNDAGVSVTRLGIPVAQGLVANKVLEAIDSPDAETAISWPELQAALEDL